MQVKSNGGLEPHPNGSLDFHLDLLGYAVDKFAMRMLFTDFLCDETRVGHDVVVICFDAFL